MSWGLFCYCLHSLFPIDAAWPASSQGLIPLPSAMGP